MPHLCQNSESALAKIAKLRNLNAKLRNLIEIMIFFTITSSIKSLIKSSGFAVIGMGILPISGILASTDFSISSNKISPYKFSQDLKTQSLQTQILKNPGLASPNPKKPPTPQEQAEILVDIKGLWAETAIFTLVAKNIFPAFSDSTFRPNDLVTRAQFREVLVKAFPASDFSNFAVGAPNQKISRAQAVVFIVNLLNLKSSRNSDLDSIFVDAAKIPAFARSSFATAKEQKLLFNYPDLQVLNPNENLTRINFAALVYQALALKGKLPRLQNSDAAQAYLVQDQTLVAKVNNQNSSNNPPRVVLPSKAEPAKVAIDPEAIRQNLRVPPPTTKQFAVAAKSTGSPSISLTVPTGFGASAGNAFVGLGYQSSTRVNDGQDAGISLGIGFGDPKDLVGLEVAFINYSTGLRSSFLRNGGFSFKLHRLVNETTSVAFGIENFATYGASDATSSVYGAISTILQLEESAEKPFSSISFTLGVGGGRFRSISDINTLQGTVNVFGSVAVRAAEPISLIADWNGQTLSVGASIKPFRDLPLVITPGITDIAGNNTNGTRINGLNGLRFTLGVGYGINF